MYVCYMFLIKVKKVEKCFDSLRDAQHRSTKPRKNLAVITIDQTVIGLFAVIDDHTRVLP